MPRAERAAKLLVEDEAAREPSGAFAAGRARGDVDLDRVSFAYTRERLALDQVSLRIPAGSRLALVGGPGAGKSTLAAIVARSYDPDRGRVTIDGRDARDCSVAWLRSQIGLV